MSIAQYPDATRTANRWQSPLRLAALMDNDPIPERSWIGAWTLDKLVIWVLAFLVVFFNGSDFRGDSGEEFTVHWQIYVQLGISLLTGVVGLMFLLPKTYRYFLVFPGILATIEMLVYGFTMPFAVEKAYSLASYASLVSTIIFAAAGLKVLGGFRLMSAFLAGLMTYLVGSWFVYFFVPSIGVFQEQVTVDTVFERMGGLGHPNELGFYSAYAVLLTLAMANAGRIRWSVATPMALFAVATLLTCYSRTAMVGCSCGLLVMFHERLRMRGNALAFAGLAMGGLLAAFVLMGTGKLDGMIAKGLEKITKSGSTEELTTATGRTEIWAGALSVIGDKPLTGYGYGAARFVMEDFSFHAHNVVLNAAIFGGILGAMVMLSIILYFVGSMIYRRTVDIDGLTTCMLVGGMVDGLLGDPTPAASILLWFIMLFWRQIGARLSAFSVEIPEVRRRFRAA